jgi:hypothetical protein
VVPKTTKHEHRTPTTAETVEGIFYSHLTTGGTDRLLRNDPRVNLHQKTTEADSLRRYHPKKTELCGRPAVSQIEVQSNSAEAPQNRARFNPQRKTAQYYQIVTLSRATLYCYYTTQESNKSETTGARQHRPPMTQIAPHRERPEVLLRLPMTDT